MGDTPCTRERAGGLTETDLANRKRREVRFKMAVTVSETDYPALCDALYQLPPGRRRAGRLLTLAHVGALFEEARTIGPAKSEVVEQTGRPDAERPNGSALKLYSEDLAVLGGDT